MIIVLSLISFVMLEKISSLKETSVVGNIKVQKDIWVIRSGLGKELVVFWMRKQYVACHEWSCCIWRCKGHTPTSDNDFPGNVGHILNNTSVLISNMFNIVGSGVYAENTLVDNFNYPWEVNKSCIRYNAPGCWTLTGLGHLLQLQTIQIHFLVVLWSYWITLTLPSS